MNRWFISDTHFAHENILRFEVAARPFVSIEEHDESLISRWNALVKPGDKVWHLGDFAFQTKASLERIVPRLNGRIRVIPGNHDPSADVLLRHFEKVRGPLFMPVGGRKVLLSHVPVHPSQFDRCVANVHGHLHSSAVMTENGDPDRRYINVSVERWSLAPVHMDEIISLLPEQCQ